MSLRDDEAQILAYFNSGMPMIQIASKMGTTKNAIAGKIHRMRQKGVAVEKEPKETVNLDSLKPFHCRYITSTSPAVYCGKKKSRGAYCAEHYALCYKPGTAMGPGARRALARLFGIRR
jgi:hypothetical protein